MKEAPIKIAEREKLVSLRGFKELVLRLSLGLILGGLVIIASFLSPAFLNTKNVLNILSQSSILGCLAIGQTLVILSAGIDLSVGSTLALSSMICALLADYNIVLVFLIALGVGSGFGAVSGVFVQKLRIPPFIATLGMMSVIRGIALVLTWGAPIETRRYVFIAEKNIGVVPLLGIIWISIGLVMHFVLIQTRVGHHLFTIYDEEKSSTSGVDVTKLKIGVYALSGFFASLGGILYISRLFHGYSMAGIGKELDSIAAVLIGGTSLFGGKGSMIGTIIGVIVLGILENLMNLLNVSMYLQSTVRGLVVLLVVYLNIQKTT